MTALKIKKRNKVTHQHPEAERLKVLVAQDRSNIVRLNVEMPREKRQALKAKVAIEGRTVHEVINQLVDDYLK